MRSRWRSLWLQSGRMRAAGETLCIAAACWLVGYLTSAHTWGQSFLQTHATLVLLDGPICALWCAARMRLGSGLRWRQIVFDGLIGAVLGVIPTILLISTAMARFAPDGGIPLMVTVLGGRYPFTWVAALVWVAFSAEFIAFRLGVRLWLYWDHLRRTKLRWALTHAHLIVVLLGVGMFSLLALVVRIHSPRDTLLGILPVVVVFSVVAVVGLAIVLPPSALFSYLFARRTIRRIAALAAATGALRAGEYAARVPVDGEDEVAQLEHNFNAMAADLERAVRDLQAERDTVSHLLESRRALIANVSHELRTPVATLRGYLEAARAHWDDAPPPTLRHDLEVMERESIRLQALIDDLFTVARADVGQLELRCEPVDVGPVARRVVETTAPLAWQSGRVTVLADAPPDLPLALADASRLEQILRNLLHNAVRHTPPGGIVAVEVTADADTVSLSVNDTGEGIGSEDLPHIFERFYRASNARDRGDGGAGLGLALARELAAAMGGTVTVASTPDQGSSFTVRVPRACPVGGLSRAATHASPDHHTPPFGAGHSEVQVVPSSARDSS